MGWISILVKTGIHQEDGNDSKYPATYVVEDLEEAIRLIFKLEGIQKEI
jgi:ribonucleotide monophosphatase NagD (HAD superfamily)